MCSNVLFVALVQLSLVVTTFAIEEELYEGSVCTLENGEQGVCKKLPDCPPRLLEVQEGKRHSTSTGRCGFDDMVEIVCCPNVFNFTDKIASRPADVACQQYDNEIKMYNAKRNEVTYHIYGGFQALSGDFPYMVALGYENKGTSDDPSPIIYDCGGSLISFQHVLTAAHCVNNINEKVPVEVRLGNENIQSTAANVQRIPISDIISHPWYRRSTHYNDVAILKLKTEVQMSYTVKPVCLQTKSVGTLTLTKRTSIVVIGWGATSFGDDNSVTLMRTPALSIVSKEECAKHYKGFLKLPRGIDDNLICAIDLNSTRAADACQGDSGGPLLMLTENGHSVIGITAFGQGCGSSVPGVYTAVYSYLDWIEEHVWVNNASKKSDRIDKSDKSEESNESNESVGVKKTGFFNVTITCC